MPPDTPKTFEKFWVLDFFKLQFFLKHCFFFCCLFSSFFLLFVSCFLDLFKQEKNTHKKIQLDSQITIVFLLFLGFHFNLHSFSKLEIFVVPECGRTEPIHQMTVISIHAHHR